MKNTIYVQTFAVLFVGILLTGGEALMCVETCCGRLLRRVECGDRSCRITLTQFGVFRSCANDQERTGSVRSPGDRTITYFCNTIFCNIFWPTPV